MPEMLQKRRQLDLLHHTGPAMQNLLMAMADAENSKGKRTWLGKDKGAIAHEKAMERLQEVGKALFQDGPYAPAPRPLKKSFRLF